MNRKQNTFTKFSNILDNGKKHWPDNYFLVRFCLPWDDEAPLLKLFSLNEWITLFIYKSKRGSAAETTMEDEIDPA